MATLAEMPCTECDEQTAAMAEEAIAAWHPQMPNWQVTQSAGRKSLIYPYKYEPLLES